MSYILKTCPAGHTCEFDIDDNKEEYCMCGLEYNSNLTYKSTKSFIKKLYDYFANSKTT